MKMAGFLQAVKDKVSVVRTRLTWSYIKTHLTKDKIIVFILIALLWGFSTVPLFLFFILPENQEASKDLTVEANMTEREPGCDLTNRENTTVKDCIYDNFYFEESTNSCVPNCYTWISYTPATSAASDGFVLSCDSIATLASIAVIIIAVINRKAVFHFPSVLVFYMSLSSLINYGTNLIGYTDKDRLFCSSMNMVENYYSPTPYCMLSGVVSDYYSLLLCTWVVCHILSIYFLIFHPLQAKQLLSSSKLKYVHLCVVLVGLLVPLLTPLITILHNLATEREPLDLGYRIVLYSPHLCRNTRMKSALYTVTFPCNFLTATAISFLVLVLWKLFQKKQFTEAKVGTVEKKILVTLCYYTLATISLPIASVISTYKYEQFEQELTTFFKCASVNGVCEQPQTYYFINPVVVTLFKLLGAAFPLFLLAYVVDCQKLKKCMIKKKGVAHTILWTSAKTQISSTKSP